ncbi:sigma 54-interacting transcriptional regulator [Dyadobacter sandarakinus]|uniref:Sigma 54-interacting transcriptional regulator n=1 Tax=Dyadobacter sandarakinus TaxID=2747268 RepID=A0ABX7I1M6_9BACT|nr:sigma 54-interacting transcriptional regulator [Dyadobacter sandarakinus]QRQ99411.1 sigma 54-interacting transcriptional regulator [Dyadobacter sandarakinus]
MTYSQLTSSELLGIRTLGELKRAGYQSKSIKQELRDNLITRIRNKDNVFPGIWGYEETVIPDVERAILSMHNINFLGLRGQAKTRIARMMINLLDEYIPYIEGSELHDDPLNPLSRAAHDALAEYRDDTPVAWLHRDERYTEKLATPDVSVADLIGDVDPIKAASLRLPYSDERVIHFGLIPRSHRGIFVINELPDLQARIQVALFNILQEGDIQIRGFKLRLPLDIQFVFTANPEDYTNRGSIVTPLKDRIESQIVTHYPKTIETGKKITEQEAVVKTEQKGLVKVNELAKTLIEQIAFEARESEYVDSKSGVSARLTISAYESLLSTAERRALINNETSTYIRVSDLYGVVSAICGKVELVYEGEVEGPVIVAQNLIGKAIRTQFLNFFPDPEKSKKSKINPYAKVIEWFGAGNQMEMLGDMTDREYSARLKTIDGLDDFVDMLSAYASAEEKLFMMEFALHGMAEFSLIGKQSLDQGMKFQDLVSSMFSGPGEDDDDYDFDDDDDDNNGRKPF